MEEKKQLKRGKYEVGGSDMFVRCCASRRGGRRHHVKVRQEKGDDGVDGGQQKVVVVVAQDAFRSRVSICDGQELTPGV
jgi:hypothetical protein